MRIFHCDRCGGVVAFAATSCPTCAAPIGYLSDERELRAIVPIDGPSTFHLLTGDGRTLRRCRNSTWGCNWMLPADSAVARCRSCRLTRGRPDLGGPDAIDAWARSEASKRRLVHQLDELALPIEAVSEWLRAATFDLRDLRLEIGSAFWDRLVGQTDELRSFRRLFGDESHGAAAGEWAEAFARYLRILDAPTPVPFDAAADTDVAGEQLAFVHEQIAAHTARNRFYAEI
jgi:hypothetical protein